MEEEIEHKAYARVGLLGNPSDVYFGKTIAFSVSNFYATVKLRPSKDLIIEPHPKHDLVRFASHHQLVYRLTTEGYYGGVRLLMAIYKVFYNYCNQNNIPLHHSTNFTLSYDTNIPRQSGLSGSSGIVCAALNCFLDFYKVRDLIKVEVRPNLILAAEEELGIVAGLQDRVAQVYGGLVYMVRTLDQLNHEPTPSTVRYLNGLTAVHLDSSGSKRLNYDQEDFNKECMDKLGHGSYIPMDLSLLPPLYLIYAPNPSDSGKVHSKVRQRWLDGDEFIVSSMLEVANIAEDGKKALEEKDYSKFAALMNRNFDLRRLMFGDDALGSVNIKMIEVARKVGAASKFTGSGGAVVAYCPEGTSQVKLLEDECHKEGLLLIPLEPFPSRLTEIDMKTLQME